MSVSTNGIVILVYDDAEGLPAPATMTGGSRCRVIGLQKI